ncbi:MAG: inositol monophosphatase family protein [Lactobacillales bacterium]|jgi:myo-inositol-1(or 4)-monophosphatase|nr:inositol monophosphatase family protein [Lactobacillales bacterium]
MIELVESWAREAGEIIKQRASEGFDVSEKTARDDLVTNVDKEIQAFLFAKIKETYPDDSIMGEEAEEGENAKIDMKKGRVWVVDPIDGTINFVLQNRDYAVMIATLTNGVPTLGLVYDVVENELFSGGPGYGVRLNGEQYEPTKKLPLNIEDGLVGHHAYMFSRDIDQVMTKTKHSLGTRIIGSAGIVLNKMIKGELAAYISNLSPWDYLPGSTILHELGYDFAKIDGGELDFHERAKVIIASPKSIEEFING